jgi:error-prone DNA polymerase
MGFYAPAQIVSDACKHGVEVRPIDVNYSDYDNTIEELSGQYKAVRLGFRQIKHIWAEDMFRLIVERGDEYKSINAMVDAGIPEAALELLADADAFRSLGLDRRQALWEISALKNRPTGMFSGQSVAKSSEVKIHLPEMSLSEHVIHDYRSMSLSLKAHPVGFVRDQLSKIGILQTADLGKYKDGTSVRVAGLVLVRQRPGTASGICFISIEDETGGANLVVFENLFEKYRKEIIHSTLLMVEGKLQIEGEVIHVIVKRCYDLTVFINRLTVEANDSESVQTLARADEKDSYPQHIVNKKTQIIQGEVFPVGRNFK